MSKKKKSYLYIPAVAISLVILIFVLKLILNAPFRSGLPDITDLQGIPAPLSEQISEAFRKAHKKPSSDNIGALGMVYH
jgi:sugar phosphate permease